MTQLFVLNSAYGLMTAVAAMDAAVIPPARGERILVTVNAAIVPEATVSLFDAPHLGSLRARFDRVVDLNDLLVPERPSHWRVRGSDEPIIEKLLRAAWSLGSSPVELFLQSPQVAPSRVFIDVFSGSPVSVIGDGLMTYAPIRSKWPHSAASRVVDVVYADTVPGLHPLLFSETGASRSPVAVEAVRRIVAEVAAETRDRALDPIRGMQRPVLVLGQYLAALNLVTAEEERLMQREMIDRGLAWAPSDIVFKPHPSSTPALVDDLVEYARSKGVPLTVYRGAAPAEVVAAGMPLVGAVAGFSTALPTLRALNASPIDAVGTEMLLGRLVPFENGNRIPVTIIDALTRPSTPYQNARRLQELIDAVAETWENGKPVRETLAADIPLAVDHFRYFAGVLRAQEGGISQLDEDTVAYHFQEPLGVVGQIIPWNFPILMAVWKLAPALAAGNCIVLKPAEQTPASILFLIDIIGDLIPPGVLNIVNGFGIEAGAPLASHRRIRKIAFTGETTTGRLIMQYASQNLIPVTLELGGKSPNVFFEDVARSQDSFYDKALEGFSFFALNNGEVCTCPSRALIQRSIYDQLLGDGIERVRAITQGNPLDPATMIGAQASNDQLEKILSYMDIGRQGGAKVLIGGERADLGGDLTDGYYVQPTIFEGTNDMRIFQEEIFGPVLSVTSFDNFDDAISIANDTLYGLGAGVWSRDMSTAYRAGRAIEAGRVWTNTYHQYPAHAAFGGYKQSGIGRENHLKMLDHYQQTKNLLVSYAEGPMGFF